MTLVKVKVKLAKLIHEDRLEVLLSGDEPLRNVSRSAKEQGYKVISVQPNGKFHKIVIEK